MTPPATRAKEPTRTFYVEFENTTPGTVRYREVTNDLNEKGHLRTVYFRKELFKELGIDAEKYDAKITVVFKPVSD